MYAKYKDDAQFLIIYIKEAHPAEGWAMEVSERLKYIKDPTSVFERYQVANTCVSALNLSIPCLLDDMNNTTALAYKGWPDRLYIVGKDGKISFRGGPGPGGFSTDELEVALKAELKKIASGSAK